MPYLWVIKQTEKQHTMNYQPILTAPATALYNKTQDYVSSIIGGVECYEQEIILKTDERRMSVRAVIALDGSFINCYARLQKRPQYMDWDNQWKDTKFYNLSAHGAQKLIDRKVKEFGL